MQEKSLVQFFKFRMTKVGQRRWSCPDESQIAAYADHQLAGPAKERMEAHLADCDFCLDQVAYLIRMQNAELPEAVPNALLLRAIKLAGEKTRPEGSALWQWGKIAAATAAACLVLVVAVSLRHPQTGPTLAPRQNPVAQPARVPPPMTPKTRSEPSPTVRGGHKTLLEPTLLFPSPGATVPENKIEFRWEPIAGTLDYEVRLLTSEGDLVWTQQTMGSSLRLPADVKVEAGKKYFVQVRTNCADGKSVQSAPVAFTVVNR